MSRRTPEFSALLKLQVPSHDSVKSLQIVGRTVNAGETKLSRFVKLNQKQQDFLTLFEASKNARDGKNVVVGQFAQNSSNSDTHSKLSDAKTSGAERSRHFPVGLHRL